MLSSIPPCPQPARLLRLLNATLPEDEQAPLMEHLERCAGCREVLEALAAGRDSWAGVARNLGGDNGPARTGPFAPPRAASFDFLEPPVRPGHLGRLDHYEVLEVIGQGGMGVVLKAFDQTLHRIVAVKVMAPELAVSGTARDRFEREARAAAAVSHDHVVTIHAVGQARKLPYLVMQYVPGQSLQQKLDRTGPLELKEILRIGLQMASGLAAAHAQGLIHRDIKPANILLENGVQRVKITDFGLARAADDASLTQSGVIAGTPQYMSPEQALGEPQDYRTDLFSLGSVLYALCTGRPPFRAPNSMAVLRRVAEEAPRPIRQTRPEIPDWLEALVKKLMEKHPVDRFQSAAEVARLLESHLADLQQPAGIPRPAPPSAAEVPPVPVVKQPPKEVRSTRRRKVAWTIGVLGLLFLAVCWICAREAQNRAEWEARMHPWAAYEVPFPPEGRRPRAVPPALAPKARFDALKRNLLCLALSNDAKALAAGFEDGSVVWWDVARHTTRTLRGHKLPVRSLAFSPTGKLLLTGAGDEPKPGAAGEVKLWDLATGKAEPGYDVAKWGPVWSVAFAPDGTSVAVTGEGGIRRWGVRTGMEWHTESGLWYVRSIAFAPNGQTVAATCDRPLVTYFDPSNSWRRQGTSGGHEDVIEAVRFSTDSRTVATGGRDGTVCLFDHKAGFSPKPRALVRVSEKASVRSLAFCRHGDKGTPVLAVGLSDQVVKLLDANNPVQPVDFPGPGERAGSEVAASADGTCLATGQRDGVIRLWDMRAGKPVVPVGPETDPRQEDKVRQQLMTLQGTWEHVPEGDARNSRGDHGYTFSFDPKRFAMSGGKEKLAGTYEIVDAASEPKQMDLFCTEGRHKGKRFRAIYRIEDGRLEICTDNGNDRRPRAFSEAAGAYYVLRRWQP